MGSYHNEVKTMIYTHVLSRVGKGVKSPVDDFKGETKVSYTETIYHIAPSLVDDLTTSIQKAFGDLCARDVMPQFRGPKVL